MRFLRPPILLLVLSAAACGMAAGTPSLSSGSGKPVAVGTQSTRLGTILVGDAGRSLYTRAGDGAAHSTCTGACATAWPPLTVPEGQQAVGGPGVSGAFGTLARPDGSLQATYEERPLYYAEADVHAGEVSGNGVDGFSLARP